MTVIPHTVENTFPPVVRLISSNIGRLGSTPNTMIGLVHPRSSSDIASIAKILFWREQQPWDSVV